MRCRQSLLPLVALASLAVVPVAHAADTCVSPGGTGGCFATIQGAIDDAQTVDGDTIHIFPGTYTESQIVVDKAVRLSGSDPFSTIVDGSDAGGVAQTGLIRITADGGDDVHIDGLTLQNPPNTGASRTAVAVKGVGVVNRAYRLSNLRIIGENVDFDNGVYADNSDARLIIEDSSISETGGNPILIERHLGALDIRGNLIGTDTGGTAVFLMSYGGDRVTAPQQIRDNRIIAETTGISVNGAGPAQGGTTEGGYRGVEITGNDIDSGTSGITLNNNGAGDGAVGRIENTAVRGNLLNGSGAAGSDGVRLRGAVVGTEISGNDIGGYATGVRFLAATSGHGHSGTIAPFNRIVGNAVGAANSTATEADLENSWWGCNAGPGAAGCDSTAGGALVDADPWLVFDVSASPTSILTGGATSTVSADVLRNSSGATPDGNVFPRSRVDFATTLGTVGSSAPTVFGIAGSTLTSGAAAGTATVTGTLDGESAASAATFTLPPPAARVEVPGPATTTTIVVPGAASSTALPSPGDLRIATPARTEVFPSGRFVVRAATVGGGRLVARGNATVGRSAPIRRLGGRAFSLTRTEDVRVKMRLDRVARRALRRGRAVSVRVTMTLTPRNGAPVVTRSALLRLVAR